MPSRRDPNSRPSPRRRKVPIHSAPAPEPEESPGPSDIVDLSGPWKVEPVPDHPGAVAVLRVWESQERGDQPEAVFLDGQAAEAFAALLPLLNRQPLLALFGTIAGVRPLAAPLRTPAPTAPPKPAAATAPTPLPDGSAPPAEGAPGPRVIGWLRRRNLQMTAALQLLEIALHSPEGLEPLRNASDGAFERLQQILMTRYQPN